MITRTMIHLRGPMTVLWHRYPQRMPTGCKRCYRTCHRLIGATMPTYHISLTKMQASRPLVPMSYHLSRFSALVLAPEVLSAANGGRHNTHPPILYCCVLVCVTIISLRPLYAYQGQPSSVSVDLVGLALILKG